MATTKKKATAKKPRKATKTTKKSTRGTKSKEDLKTTAKNLFEAAGKEAYYLGDRAIHNLHELVNNLVHFSEEHAGWVADWIEYLGDSKTAKRIRKKTGDFKKIIEKRYKELKKHHP
jgi:hypothetical protein